VGIEVIDEHFENARLCLFGNDQRKEKDHYLRKASQLTDLVKRG